MVLNEFDSNHDAFINPTDYISKIDNFPRVGISCFSKKLLDRLVCIFNGEEIAKLSTANGENPVYKIKYNGKEFALFMSRVGASACCVGLEEIFAMGLEKVIVFGNCGVLDKNIEDLGIIIPTSAVRDEGTSYHYLEESREVECNKKYIDSFINLLNDHGYSYTTGKTWTTDAPYRETNDKILNRKNEGCICVEMECSAIQALCKFREKDCFVFFYAGDNLDSTNWEIRSLEGNVKLDEKEKIGLLAVSLGELM